LEILNFEDLKTFNQRTVLSIGMFDGVHRGHLSLLEELKQEAKRLDCCSMVISFDKHPRQVISNNENEVSILQSQEERWQKLSESGVDYLLILHFTKQMAMLEASDFLDLILNHIQPLSILLGYDNRFGRKDSNQFDELLEKGNYKNIEIKRTQACIWHKEKQISSTQIRKALLNGEISLANQMLGYSYSLSGKVVDGYKIGRTLGFPTANIEISNNKLLPKQGVYAVKCKIAEENLKAVLSIGERETFNFKGLCIEAHIFDFNKQIYSQTIEIEFIEKIRDQKKFATIEELKEEIKRDCEYAKNILFSV
jgi:riboflavin kinase/FMN adenylyltransferase